MKHYLPDGNLFAKKNSITKTFLLFWLLLSFVNFSFAQGNNLIEISGRVENQQTKEPLASVSIQIKGTVAGTITNKAGQFSIKTRNKFPLTLVFSSIGFEQQEFEVKSINSKLSIALVTQTDFLQVLK